MTEEVTAPVGLQATIEAINKEYGKGTLITSRDKFSEVKFVNSGCISVNRALNGGWARGRIIEIYGQESSGKTTLALHAIAEVQKEKGVAAFIDAEHALDIKYAHALGVDVDKLLISQPESGEQALNVCEMLVNSGEVDLIVIDSVAALVPKAELEGEMGDQHMGLQARMMSQAMRKLTGACSKQKTCVIFINQIRQKIGIVYGNPNVTTGGNALKFYASQRVEISRKGQIKEGTGKEEEIVASETLVKVVKNKVGAPFKEASIQIKFGVGIDKNLDLLRLAVEKNIVDKAGSWYSFENARLGQGETQVTTFFEANPVIMQKIWSKVEEAFNS